MLKELDIVRLKKDDIENGVKITNIGAIVDVLPGNIYTVEFIDDNGETIEKALFKTYSIDELIKVE